MNHVAIAPLLQIPDLSGMTPKDHRFSLLPPNVVGEAEID
jgi:hypothetical protein